VPGLGVALDAPADFETIHPGHPQVQDHHIGPARGDDLTGGEAVVSFEHLAIRAFRSDFGGDPVDYGRLVIDDQDSGSGWYQFSWDGEVSLVKERQEILDGDPAMTAGGSPSS
jgi:hypothetical protein